jgi:hypothetical protein
MAQLVLEQLLVIQEEQHQQTGLVKLELLVLQVLLAQTEQLVLVQLLVIQEEQHQQTGLVKLE